MSLDRNIAWEIRDDVAFNTAPRRVDRIKPEVLTRMASSQIGHFVGSTEATRVVWARIVAPDAMLQTSGTGDCGALKYAPTNRADVSNAGLSLPDSQGVASVTGASGPRVKRLVDTTSKDLVNPRAKKMESAGESE